MSPSASFGQHRGMPYDARALAAMAKLALRRRQPITHQPIKRLMAPYSTSHAGGARIIAAFHRAERQCWQAASYDIYTHQVLREITTASKTREKPQRARTDSKTDQIATRSSRRTFVMSLPWRGGEAIKAPTPPSRPLRLPPVQRRQPMRRNFVRALRESPPRQPCGARRARSV